MNIGVPIREFDIEPIDLPVPVPAGPIEPSGDDEPESPQH
jgi:hypothetical protein